MQLVREVLAIALLNAKLRLLKKLQISVGTLNESLAHPREILKAVIYQVILSPPSLISASPAN
jgi:DNA repair protein RadC